MKFTPILSAIEQGVQNGLSEHGEAMLADSNERAPKDTRAMVESGFVQVDDLTVQVGYSSFIAKIQHENLDYQHPSGGGPKFLENAAAATAGQLDDVIAKNIGRALGG